MQRHPWGKKKIRKGYGSERKWFGKKTVRKRNRSERKWVGKEMGRKGNGSERKWFEIVRGRLSPGGVSISNPSLQTRGPPQLKGCSSLPHHVVFHAAASRITSYSMRSVNASTAHPKIVLIPARPGSGVNRQGCVHMSGIQSDDYDLYLQRLRQRCASGISNLMLMLGEDNLLLLG